LLLDAEALKAINFENSSLNIFGADLYVSLRMIKEALTRDKSLPKGNFPNFLKGPTKHPGQI
jgi:hypothetical protein